VYVVGRTRAGKGTFIRKAINTHNGVDLEINRSGAAAHTMRNSNYSLNNGEILVDTRGFGEVKMSPDEELIRVYDLLNGMNIKAIVYVYSMGFLELDKIWAERILTIVGDASHMIFLCNRDEVDCNEENQILVGTSLGLSDVSHFTLPHSGTAEYDTGVQNILDMCFSFVPFVCDFQMPESWILPTYEYSDWVIDSGFEITVVTEEYKESVPTEEATPIIGKVTRMEKESTPAFKLKFPFAIKFGGSGKYVPVTSDGIIGYDKKTVFQTVLKSRRRELKKDYTYERRMRYPVRLDGVKLKGIEETRNKTYSGETYLN